MTEEEIRAIEQRIKDANNTGGEMWYAEAIGPVADTDVPALIAEVRRLRDWQKRAAVYCAEHCGCADPECSTACALLSELPKVADGD